MLRLYTTSSFLLFLYISILSGQSNPGLENPYDVYSAKNPCIMDTADHRIKPYYSQTWQDFRGPQINIAPVAGQVQQPLDIQATITDDSGVTGAFLYYRAGGEHHFYTRDMVVSGQGSYKSTIPSTAVSERGIEFYIRAVDNHGNVTTDPQEEPVNSPHAISVSFDGLNCPYRTPAESYCMISIPADLDNDSPYAVLEDNFGSHDRSQWRLIRVQSSSYVEYNYGDRSIDYFEPGNAFWLITKQNKTWSTGSGKSVLTNQNYKITLSPGWNQIGNPFAFPVDWNDVIKTSDIERKLVGYCSYSGEGIGYDYNQTRLEPWLGYFVKNKSNNFVTIEIPPKAAATDMRKQNSMSVPESLPEEWQLQIIAQCKQYVDKDNYIGCLENAEDENDALDFSEAPFFDQYIALYFSHNDWQEHAGLYSGDYRRTSGDGNIWDFEVKTNIDDETVILSLGKRNNLPNDWHIVLIDVAKNNVIDFLEKRNFIFESNSGETTRKFTLMVGPAGFIEFQKKVLIRVPKSFCLSQNYPNPFNSSTQIVYSLPTDTQVRLVVYDVLGSEAAILVNGREKAGDHAITFDGSHLESGVYMCVLETQQCRVAQRMLLLK